MLSEKDLNEMQKSVWSTACKYEPTNEEAAQLFCSIAGSLAKQIPDKEERIKVCLQLIGHLGYAAGLVTDADIAEALTTRVAH